MTVELPSNVVVAAEAVEVLKDRHEVARDALIEFAIKAVFEGHDIDEIAKVCGFIKKENKQEPNDAWSIWSPTTTSPRQAFANWLASELIEKITKESA